VIGEMRHERCRFGSLTQAWSGSDLQNMKPGVEPLCGYMPEGPLPPPLKRAWGGTIVDPEQDCRICERYTELAILNEGK
jgi:hypothetical protein